MWASKTGKLTLIFRITSNYIIVWSTNSLFFPRLSSYYKEGGRRPFYIKGTYSVPEHDLKCSNVVNSNCQRMHRYLVIG